MKKAKNSNKHEIINSKIYKNVLFNKGILLYKVVSVFCLSRRILLNAEYILFSFIAKLLIGPGIEGFKLIFGRVSSPPSPKNFFFTLLNTNFEWYEVDFSPSYLKFPRVF